jgi:hypothetical protein
VAIHLTQDVGFYMRFISCPPDVQAGAGNTGSIGRVAWRELNGRMDIGMLGFPQ